MEERLILLDNDDNAIGEGSKKDCKFTLQTIVRPVSYTDILSARLFSF